MALMMLAVLGKGVMNVVIALIIAEWATYTRTVRGTALVEREKEYIEAARSLEVPGWRILFRHLLPNCLAPVIVIATMQVARAIGLEATLSFLGLGASVTQPDRKSVVYGNGGSVRLTLGGARTIKKKNQNVDVL